MHQVWGTVTQGNTIRSKDMMVRSTFTSRCCYNSENWCSALTDVTQLGSAVSFQTRVVKTGPISGFNIYVHIYVGLSCIDKNAHTVLITSEVLKLNRYLRVSEAQDQRHWHLVYKNAINQDVFKFDMEVTLVEEVNERTVERLALALWEDEETTDVELVGTDGKEVRTHKNVLAMASPFLRAAFHGSMKEAREGRLVVPDADLAALKALKKFAYTGTVDTEPATLTTLLPIAHRFQMPDLASACAGLLAHSLPADELVSLLPLDLQQPEQLLFKEMIYRFDAVKIEEMTKNTAKAKEPENQNEAD